VDLTVAILQVVAALAAVAAVSLALVTLRDARTERQEERDWRREERRERWLDQLQEVAVIVDEILATVPNMRFAERDRLQLRLRVKLKGIHWTPVVKTHALADFKNYGELGANTEGVAKAAQAELDATFKRIFG
jgi:hypothetical protein